MNNKISWDEIVDKLNIFIKLQENIDNDIKNGKKSKAFAKSISACVILILIFIPIMLSVWYFFSDKDIFMTLISYLIISCCMILIILYIIHIIKTHFKKQNK